MERVSISDTCVMNDNFAESLGKRITEIIKEYKNEYSITKIVISSPNNIDIEMIRIR